MQWSRRSVAGRRPHTAEERVQPSPFHDGFVVDKVHLTPVYMSSPVSTIPPVFHARSLKSIGDAVLSSAVDTIVKRQTLTQNVLSKCWLTLEFDYLYRRPRKILQKDVMFHVPYLTEDPVLSAGDLNLGCVMLRVD